VSSRSSSLGRHVGSRAKLERWPRGGGERIGCHDPKVTGPRHRCTNYTEQFILARAATSAPPAALRCPSTPALRRRNRPAASLSLAPASRHSTSSRGDGLLSASPMSNSVRSERTPREAKPGRPRCLREEAEPPHASNVSPPIASNVSPLSRLRRCDVTPPIGHGLLPTRHTRRGRRFAACGGGSKALDGAGSTSTAPRARAGLNPDVHANTRS
jgi:hypothetical protein